MNIEAFKELRDTIASAPAEHCDMWDWRCGSVCCIGGWTENLLVARGVIQPRKCMMNVSGLEWTSLRDRAVNSFLGIIPAEHENLFFTFPDEVPSIGWQAWMLARLDKIIETGDIEAWDRESSVVN